MRVHRRQTLVHRSKFQGQRAWVLALGMVFVCLASAQAESNNYAWWNKTWHYRTKATIMPGVTFNNGIIYAKVNFTTLFTRLGRNWLTLDDNSIRVIAYDKAGSVANGAVSVTFVKDLDFDATIKASGTINWLVTLEEARENIYFIYFDSTTSGSKPRASGTPPSFFPSANALVGSWELGEVSGTTAHDLSGRGVDAKVYGGATTGSQEARRYLNFDGSNDYVEIPHYSATENMPNFTIEAVFKLSSIDKNRIYTILCNGPEAPGYHVWLGIDLRPASTFYRKIWWELGGRSNRLNVFSDPFPWEANRRYHISASWNNAAQQWSIIVNDYFWGGTRKDSWLTTDGGVFFGSGNIQIGAYSSTGHLLHGAVENVRVFNAAASLLPAFVSQAPDMVEGIVLPAIRGAWLQGLPSNVNPAMITEQIRQIKNAGINTIFLYVSSHYAESLKVLSAWNAVAAFIDDAHRHEIKVHLWVIVTGYGVKELQVHPEWSCRDINNGTTYTHLNSQAAYGVDLAIPAAKEYEKQYILDLVQKCHPDGIHLEEPYYHSGGAVLSYTPDFLARVKKKLGYENDPTFDPKNAPQGVDMVGAMREVRKEVIGDFVRELREALCKNYPNLMFSVNGNGTYRAINDGGLDAISWAQDGSIDFYVPMIYTKDRISYVNSVNEVLSVVNTIPVYIGTAITWSGIYPEHNPTFFDEIKALSNTGAAGFVQFAFNHFTPDEINALGAIPSQEAMTNGFCLKGVVHDTQGTVLDNVIVKIPELSEETTTDTQGRYVLFAPAGSYTVSLSQEGRFITGKPIFLRGNTNMDFSVRVSHLPIGDVSDDGQVTANDARLVAQYAVELIKDPEVPGLCSGLSAEDFRRRGDVDGVSGLSANDAMLIAKRAVGLIEKFPVEG